MASETLAERRADSACFDGMLLATLAYGALLMIFIQLAQVLLIRPKRGRVFWALVVYSAIMFPLASVAIGGKLKFAESMYVVNRDFDQGPKAYYLAHGGQWVNVMSQISTTLLPWAGDLLMIYRLMVLWDSRRWVMAFPTVIYLARVAMSIPLLVAESRPFDPKWAVHTQLYGMTYYALCVSLNILFTSLICIRIYILRPKVQQVLGKLPAVYYTSGCTMVAESGAFFTVWAICYIIANARRSWIQDVFLQPYIYVLGITRMLIILRMAQDRAWSKDIVTASASGVLDWQVSSTHSIPLNDSQNGQISHEIKKLPRKYAI